MYQFKLLGSTLCPIQSPICDECIQVRDNHSTKQKIFDTPSRVKVGRLAQLVEQLTLNQRVVGSIPPAPTRIHKPSGIFRFLKKELRYTLGILLAPMWFLLFSAFIGSLSELYCRLIVRAIISGTGHRSMNEQTLSFGTCPGIFKF